MSSKAQVCAVSRFLFYLGFITLTVVACAVACSTEPRTLGEALLVTDTHRSNGDYDHALAVAHRWMSANPEEGMMHAEVAFINLEKASVVPGLKNQLIENAVEETYKAVELAPESFRTLEMARIALETSADWTVTARCKRYRNALALTDHLAKAMKAKYEKEKFWPRRESGLNSTRVRLLQKATSAGCTLAPISEAPQLHK